jgi:hypothetical protein
LTHGADVALGLCATRAPEQSGAAFAGRTIARTLAAMLASAIALPVGAGVASTAPDARQQVADGAALAQSRCYRLIHHDTFEFEDCLTGMLSDERKPTPRRLGIEYFGFVGALNSARLGMLGAEDAAWDFLARFRATQKTLGFDDATLCATIAGDCEVRIARMKLMLASPRPAPAAKEAQPSHTH